MKVLREFINNFSTELQICVVFKKLCKLMYWRNLLCMAKMLPLKIKSNFAKSKYSAKEKKNYHCMGECSHVVCLLQRDVLAKISQY